MKMSGLTKGIGGSAIEGVVGLVSFYGHRMLSEKSKFVQDKPLSVPIGMIVLGHVLKKSRRLNPVGTALCGIGGYAGAQVYELKKAATQANPQANTPATNTKGFDDDTGALTQPGDIGALTQPGDIGAFGYSPTAGSAYSDAYGL